MSFLMLVYIPSTRFLILERDSFGRTEQLAHSMLISITGPV